MLDEIAAGIAASPSALVLLFALVFGDAFLVVLPGEIAVTVLGAASTRTGSPPLIAVIVLAWLAAWAGDLGCYGIGRAFGTSRFRWMRAPRVQRAIRAAGDRLSRRAATAVFTARFIPFARLAVNLTAGATRVPGTRFLVWTGCASLAWAAYQACIGAVVASLVPGGAGVAIIVSIVVALLLGLALDALVSAISRAITRRNQAA